MHPFRDFSSSLYCQPGVADAALFVQDRYGLNVNLVLFCVWVADTGGGELTGGNIDQALRRIADWQKQVIEPLREVRSSRCGKSAACVDTRHSAYRSFYCRRSSRNSRRSSWQPGMSSSLCWRNLPGAWI